MHVLRKSHRRMECKQLFMELYYQAFTMFIKLWLILIADKTQLRYLQCFNILLGQPSWKTNMHAIQVIR
jgi:hypothetical protein